MTGESIGTARLDIVVDTSQFDTAITAAKRSVSGMSQAAQAEYNKLNGAEKRRIDSLIKQADTLGFTRQQQILYNAALRGTPTNVLDELKKKLSGTGDAAAKAGIQLNQYGVSAKQTAAALRGVPAQLTDIFTSLQGGQAPLTVLLQQGGQLKDMFGGIRPAAAALGGQLLALVNPITLTAAAVAGLAVAWYKGAQESEDFNKALILTGNYAGTTSAQLSGLAQEMDALAGVTTRSAAAALTEVAASGQFTAEQVEQVGIAAEKMRVATGKEVSATIAEFVKLKGDPVTAILELNKTQHFLTEATLDHIVALKDQGNELGAAQAAMDAYAQNIDSVTVKLEENLGYLQRFGREAKRIWGEIVDGALSIGREVTAADLGERIKQQQEVLAGLSQASLNRGFGDATRETIRSMQAQLVAMGLDASEAGNGAVGSVDSAEKIKELDELKKAGDEWNRWQDQNLSKRQKQQAEEAKIVETGKALGKTETEINAQLAASRARFAESMAKSSRKSSTGTDPTDSIIARIKQQIALNEAQLKSEEKLNTSDRLRVQVQTELERLGGKATGARRAEIATLLEQVVASGKLADAHVQEKKALEDLGRLKAQLAAAELNQSRANEIDLMGIGRGGNAADMLRRQLDIQRELEDGLDRINRDAKGKTEDALAAEEAALRESIARRLDMEREYQEARAALQTDWKNGAIKAYEDYIAMADDVAARSNEFFSSTFSGLEDAIVGFATGSKDAFGKMLDDMYASAVRFLAQQAIKKLFGGEGEDGGWFSALLGGASGAGSDSGTNWGSIFDLFKGGDWGFAKGGAFAGGVQAFAKGGAFTNQVVTQPTQFRFAKGIGLMGEAGPEAIMPLKRGRDGRLGVEAAAVVESAGGDNYFNTTFLMPNQYTRQTQAQINQNNARVQSRAVARSS